MAKNMPNCSGSGMILTLEQIDEDGYALCPICEHRFAANESGKLRKHQGRRAKGPIAAELKNVPDTAAEEPQVEVQPKAPVVEKLIPTHPPTKEIGLIINVSQEDTRDIHEIVDWLKSQIDDLPNVTRSTLTHCKYYYDGKFYNKPTWDKLTEG